MLTDSPLLDVAFIGWSSDLRLTRVEGASEAVLQATPEALVGKPLSEVLGIDKERARQLDAKARELPPGAVEFVQARSSTEPRPTFRMVLGSTDAGAQASVMNLHRLLEGAPPVQISRLSSSLSHEIRNPLSSVKMAVQTLARNTNLSERDRRRLTIANREIRTMERMLWMLSEYGRDSTPNLEPAQLRTVLQEAAAMVGPELAERRMELRVSEEPELPKVRVDAGRLRPVLAQVLLNVAMGQEEGSEVEVALRRGADHDVLLLLRDPAAALPSEERGTLFEPFGTRVARGAGLSFAALRRVMVNQGGDVWAEGSGASGLVFMLKFAI